MVGQAVEVLLGLVLVLEFPVPVDDAVTVALEDLVFVPNPDVEVVGVAEFVFDEILVLDIDEEPVDVLLGASVLVTVTEDCLVWVTGGDRETDAEEVGVLDPRIEPVCEPEPDDVFDEGGELVYEGVAELVFDNAADPVVVFDIVVVFVEVELLVSVLDTADDTENPGLEDEDFDPIDDLVLVIEDVIVLVEVGEGVNNRVGSEDPAEVAVFVDVLEPVVDRVAAA
jgi:hypothetical protein